MAGIMDGDMIFYIWIAIMDKSVVSVSSGGRSCCGHGHSGGCREARQAQHQRTSLRIPGSKILCGQIKKTYIYLPFLSYR